MIIHYMGDVNIEHGGYFYSVAELDRNGYADAMRVTPCSDADGPDNVYWLEVLTVNPRDDMRLAYDCIGIEADYIKTLTPFQRKCLIVDACISYGWYDVADVRTVQVGAKMAEHSGRFDPVTPSHVIRANASLFNYAKRYARESF